VGRLSIGVSFRLARAFFTFLRARTALVSSEDTVASPSFLGLSGLGCPNKGFTNPFKGNRTASNLVIRVSEYL
jgi:hypothetical protein